MTDMSKAELDLEAIEARVEAATPGPWRSGAKVGRTIYTGRDVLMGVLDCAVDAAFIASARTDVPALVRELREARRERDALMKFAHDDNERADSYMEKWRSALTSREERNDECNNLQRHLNRCAEERDEARAALAASEKRCAELEAVLGDSADAGMAVRKLAVDSIARAERAEAACAQMRAALEEVDRVHSVPGVYKGTQKRVKAALVTDVGAGYVSPEQHAEALNREAKIATAAYAEVVRERDEARASAQFNLCATAKIQGELDAALDQLAEVTAQAAVMRRSILHVTEGRHRRCAHGEGCGVLLDGLASDCGKALAERVRLLDAVVDDMRAMPLAHHRARYEGDGDPGCYHTCLACKRDDSLAALDAHNKQGGAP